MSSPALIVPLPALIVSLPAYISPKKLAPNVLNNILRSPSFCYFSSFLIAELSPFIYKADSSRDLSVFMI